MAKITLTIDEAYNEQVMSHGDVRAKALKDYSQDELLELAILARQAPIPNALSRCFKNLPELDKLQAAKVDVDSAKIVVPDVEVPLVPGNAGNKKPLK